MQSAVLSPRLHTLHSLVERGYEHVWDCCCDHGKLGLSLLSNKVAPNVHLVDVVPELIENVAKQLPNDSGSNFKGFTHCLDAAKLPLNEYEGRHLVIIAGVGGELAKQILCSLHEAFPELTIDYLLCPLRQLYALRSELNDRSFVVKNEKLVKDKGRFYEVMLVSKKEESSNEFPIVSKVGDIIWDASTEREKLNAREYLNELIAHYSRMQKAKDPQTEEILRSYRSITLSK